MLSEAGPGAFEASACSEIKHNPAKSLESSAARAGWVVGKRRLCAFETTLPFFCYTVHARRGFYYADAS